MALGKCNRGLQTRANRGLLPGTWLPGRRQNCTMPCPGGVPGWCQLCWPCGLNAHSTASQWHAHLC